MRKIVHWFVVANGVALGLFVLYLIVEMWIHAPLFMGVLTYLILLLLAAITYD